MALAQMFLRCVDGCTRLLDVPCDGTNPTVRGTAVLASLVALEPEAPWEDALVARMAGMELRWDDEVMFSVDERGMLPSCSLSLRLKGGKGGFGAQLRGTRTKMADNFDACRDLQGRRIRVVEAEKKMKKWEEDSKEREIERLAQEHINKVERQRKREQKSDADLKKYQDVTSDITKRTREAVEEAMRESLVRQPAKKRKIEDAPAQKQAWMPTESLYSSEDEEDTKVEGERASGEFEPLSSEKHVPFESTSSKHLPDITEHPPNAQTRTSSNDTSTRDESSLLDNMQVETLNGAKETNSLDLSAFSSAEELESLGLERLKVELQAKGLKCGGSLKERANRLFMLRTTPLSRLDRKHLARPLRPSH